MLYCDFCGKSTKEVKRMIAGSEGAAICDECVMICMRELINTIKDIDNNTISIKESETDSKNVRKY